MVAALVGGVERPVNRAPSPFGRSRRLSLVMAAKTPRPPSQRVGRPRPSVPGTVLVAQGRLLDGVADGVADGAVLSGTTDELAGRLDVSIAAFRAALRELAAARWIVAQTQPDGRLTVRWERRQHRVPIPLERRRSAD